jgi:hypothetical protein
MTFLEEIVMLRFFLALAIIALAPAAYAADAKQMEENKKTVLEFYDAAINQKDFEAAAKFLGPPRRSLYSALHVDFLGAD